MKIQEVTIEGFQSHVQSTFSLSPGLTVITGPSDAGKTAIIRALRWFAFNEPTGEAFLHTIRNPDGSIKQAAEQARISVTFDDGTVITKTRRKGKTTYTHNAYPTPWEKAEVPPEIKETLGLVKQEYGDFETCLNFAFQLDAPFLLSETASVGAKVLGKLAGTEVVDLAISEVNKRTHQTRTEISYEDKQIGEIDVQLTEYLELDNADKALTAVEAAFTKLKDDQNIRNELIALLNAYEANTERRIALHDKVDALASVIICRVNLNTADRQEHRREKLEELYKGFWKAIADQKEPDRVIRLTRDLDTVRERLTTVVSKEQMIKALTRLLGRYTDASDTVMCEGLIVGGIVGKLALIPDIECISKDYGRMEDLKRINEALDDAVAVEMGLRQELAALCEKTALRGKYEATETSYKALDNLKRLSAVFTSRQLSITAATKNVGRCIEAIKEAKKELREAWEEAGGVCPLCGSEGV
ncbi:AAA family ATPase [uncultured Robinsoniella sp.]|uniref:AAA family ATPase n=1 Tax=uncultured Robinsoniella sp. TaxID=904190 RepID=UPI00374EEB8F